MGKVILQVDVHEILSLAWGHPFMTGLLVLMCTPPLFPVVMYFSPLLISTALVAVLLISAGRAPIEARERETTWWNAKVGEEDNSAPKAEEVKHHSRFPGEERFLEWFHSLQSASLRSSPRSSPPVTPPRTPMQTIKGQRSFFRPDESALEFGKEEITSRQLKGRLDFERSFSFRTGERVAAAAGIGDVSPPALPSPIHSPGPPATQMVSIPTEVNQFNDASAPEIPSMFRYDERSGARGLTEKKHHAEKHHAEKYHGGDETFTNVPSRAKATPPPPSDNLSARIDKNTELIPFGSFNMSEIIDAVERAYEDAPDPEPQRSIFEMGHGSAPTTSAKVSPLKSLSSKKFSRQHSIVSNRASEGEFGVGGAQNAKFEEDKRQTFRDPESPGLFRRDNGGNTQILRDDIRSRSFSSTFRAGNAPALNSSSKISSANCTGDSQGLPPMKRKVSNSGENRKPSPSRLWKATSWQTPQSPKWQSSQTESRQPPQTPNRQTSQPPSWQTPQTPNRQSSLAPKLQTPQTPSRNPSNWNWHAPPSAIWQHSQSGAWDAAPLSNWQSPARAQRYQSWQESPLPSWQEPPAPTPAGNTLRTSRSRGVRKLDEYNRYQSELNDRR